MPRPQKCRSIQGGPRVTCFKPSGIPARSLETVVLGLDELEAIRLADLEKLYQEEAAARMHISRPTFGRLISQARGKVADALFFGKALVFQGGAVSLGESALFRCGACGERWQVPAQSQVPGACVTCGSARISGLGAQVEPLAPGAPAVGPGGGQGRGQGRGRGRGGRGGGGQGGRGARRGPGCRGAGGAGREG